MSLKPTIYQTSTDNALLWLLTITTSNEIIRLVNNMEDIVSRGNKYTAYPFNISLPVEDGSKQLSLDAYDR